MGLKLRQKNLLERQKSFGACCSSLRQTQHEGGGCSEGSKPILLTKVVLSSFVSVCVSV